MKSQFRHIATDRSHGGTVRTARPQRPISWTDKPKDSALTLVAGAGALLALGALVGMLLSGGERSAATAAPQEAVAEVALEAPPVRKVKTTSIVVKPTPDAAEPATEAPAEVSPSVVAPASPELPGDDPRWAKAAGAPPAPVSPAQLAEALEASNPAGEIVLNSLAPAEDPSADLMTTAAVSRNAERVLDREFPLGGDASAVMAPDEAALITPDAPAVDGPAVTRTVRIARGVNLRAGPSGNSRVIRVLSARTSVGLVGCNGWCEVVHDGARGYVWPSYIEGQTRTASRSKPRAPARAKVAKAKAKVAVREQPAPAPAFVPKPTIVPDKYDPSRSR